MRVKATTATALNNLCWAAAVAGVGLEATLADCDAGLAKQPDAGFIHDSRGLVLLRLGRIDDAVATYDRALAAVPGMAHALYGRSLARARKGDAAAAAANKAAALKSDADMETRYKEYGVVP